jgi:hypothetical protein
LDNTWSDHFYENWVGRIGKEWTTMVMEERNDDGVEEIVVDFEEKYSKYAHVGDAEELESVYSAFR